MKTIKIKYIQRKEKTYPFLFGFGLLLLYAFLRGIFLAKEWIYIFGEAFMLFITIALLYGGYKGYKNRHKVEYSEEQVFELKNLKQYTIREVKINNGKP